MIYNSNMNVLGITDFIWNKTTPCYECCKANADTRPLQMAEGMCPKREYTKLKGYDDICGISPDE